MPRSYYLLSDSGAIKPKGSLSYRFFKPGIYHFSSPVYPWMKGIVLVSDDITSKNYNKPKK